MQKICAIFLLSALLSNCEALPQTKWSRPIRNSQGQLTRERRQFPFGEWIPLNQACPTCRPFADPLDSGLRGENIGLTPPRPPTVTRQIHSEGNFFAQDESSILSVPPPPPSAVPRLPLTNSNGNFQFSNFGQQFNSPLPVPTQQIFPQTQQVQFLPQNFLSNQQLLVNNGNQQILSSLNNANNIFVQENQGKQQVINGKIPAQKAPENVVLEQNKRPKPSPFTLPQQQQQQQSFGNQQQQVFNGKQQSFNGAQQNFGGQQQSFSGQQSFGGQQQTFSGQQSFGGQQQNFGRQQQQHSVNFGDSILTPPPAPNNVSQNVVIPGLDKEEIQLLYVPVETLRQRGNFQEQLLSQQPQNIQFNNRPTASQRPPSSLRPTEQTTTTIPKGHFVTQGDRDQTLSTLKLTSNQPFSTSATPSPLLLQNLPFSQTPQPFVSATPSTPTIQPFVTSSPTSQKFSPFTPETTLPQLSTIANSIQFSQPDLEFGTTPKIITKQGGFQEQNINGKTQFTNFKGNPFQNVQQIQQQQNLQQAFVAQQQQKQNFAKEQQKDVEIQNQISNKQLVDQQQLALQKQEEQQRLLQQQKEKELEEQYLLKQRQQKELEAQRLLQEQRLLEEQRLLQQQRQKELEEQRLLQQQRQKELEEQRFLQQQKQKELERQRYLQQQKEKELENQRRLQAQRQKELEEKRRIQQIKQKEEEQQRLLRFQQQQKELEEQRLRQQQEEQERLLLQRQKQENLKKKQQLQFLQQQQLQQQQQPQQQQFSQQAFQQQQQQQFSQQAFQQQNRHKLPANDHLNSISQLEKESEPESNQNLVPHQPPLSVFYKGFNGAEAKIVDVLRELRSSNTITVLDQYFEKMPKVFVGPAGLIPPAGYGKFELPYLSNIETNKIERKVDRLPFFVAPLNFVPPPGYAKIPFPAPHVGSVVVSSESNPAMKQKDSAEPVQVALIEKDRVPESYPVVGPELPGLINGLETETTTIKPVTFPSTPSLPQTTAQLRNRRPNSSLYRTQSRKPVSKTRPQTTSRPEEDVTQPLPKFESNKDSDSGFRKPFNRFLNRRRQQTKTTTTESSIPTDAKNLENRHYSVEVYHQQKNTNELPRQQQKSDFILNQNAQNEHAISSIDRSTPGGHGVFDVSPTPGFHNVQPTGSAVGLEEHRSRFSEYSDANLQTFEDGPLPTGSAKTITQELYRPNTIRTEQQQLSEISSSKLQPKQESSQSQEKFQYSSFEEQGTPGVPQAPDVNPTSAFISSTTRNEGFVSAQQTQETEFEGQERPQDTSEKYYATESPRTENPFTPSTVTASGEQYTKGLGDEQYSSAFAEISKHHHFPTPTEPARSEQSNFHDIPSTAGISIDLQAPYSQEQQSQEHESSAEPRPTQTSDYYNNQYVSTGSSNEYSSGVGVSDSSLNSHTGPTIPTSSQEQYSTVLSVNSDSQDTNKQSQEERRPSFISFQDTRSTLETPVSPQSQYFPSSTIAAIQEHIKTTEENYKTYNENVVSGIPEVVSVNPSEQPQKSEDSVQVVNQQTAGGHGQEFDDDSLNAHRQRFSNPSIVRVRTRGRGKSRGQVNFAASQSTTHAPIIRSRVETKNTENTEQEYGTKANGLRDYQPVKTSKYNQYRGLKKPVRTTTSEPVTESEHKSNVYTIRPQRRPSNPSTVSTKRIRRPTTPISTVETATEAFGFSSIQPYTRTEESEFPPSGVSNDVYYEHTSLSPVRQKFRKHFGSAEQKSDVVPNYGPTAFPSTAQSYSPSEQYEYEAASVVKEQAESVSVPPANSESYPEWNPSESGLDVSGIVLTTAGPSDYDLQPEAEEPKKTLDAKKAFDPDLEKKSGRRRVRVRVHKRPHENFETAESQNLRTVANVLVPPTSTYKPNDENNFHQLAKNAEFSFSGQKLFGHRSREYFRKRLNLTQVETSEGNRDEDQSTSTAAGNESTQKPTGKKVLSFVRKTPKVQKSEFETASVQSSEVDTTANDADKTQGLRTKHRGYVRKIIKHRGGSKEVDTGSTEESEGSNEHHEFHQRQHPKVEGINHTGRSNGTRHRTLVRFVKKHKIRPHETESHQETTSEEVHQSEEEAFYQTTDSTKAVEHQQTEFQTSTDGEITEQRYPVYQSPEPKEPKSPEPTEANTTTEQIQHLSETSQETEAEHETTLSSLTQTTATQSAATQTAATQKPKLYQNLRPAFQRPTYTGFQRTREPTSTTENVPEIQEKRDGSFRPKYGKNNAFSSTGEEVKRQNVFQPEQQKNKNLHTLEVRKYLRTKSKEGVFSQFSKNRYYTSEKTETVETTQEHQSKEGHEEETTTPVEKVTKIETVETTSYENKPQTTTLVASEEHAETTENYESRLQTTTEAIEESTEEYSEEDSNESEHEITDVVTEITTEVPTTVFQTSTFEKTEQKTDRTESQQTETQPDLYSFVKSSFSFDEAEKFTGTKNRAHVRNITADVIENTASFSAPGIEKHVASEEKLLPTTVVTSNEKTEETTAEYTTADLVATTTENLETLEIETTPATEPVTKAKVAKLIKTSTTTKISHETEICYKGKCIRTKSENPDDDLKLLVDSANIMKIEKPKT